MGENKVISVGLVSSSGGGSPGGPPADEYQWKIGFVSSAFSRLCLLLTVEDIAGPDGSSVICWNRLPDGRSSAIRE